MVVIGLLGDWHMPCLSSHSSLVYRSSRVAAKSVPVEICVYSLRILNFICFSFQHAFTHVQNKTFTVSLHLQAVNFAAKRHMRASGEGAKSGWTAFAETPERHYASLFLISSKNDGKKGAEVEEMVKRPKHSNALESVLSLSSICSQHFWQRTQIEVIIINVNE